MKKVNWRVSSPPPEVQTAKVALLQSRPQRHPADQSAVAQRGQADDPPQDGGDGGDGVGDREPGSGVLRAQAEDTPDGGQFQDPEEVGVALDVFARIEDQAVTFKEVACVAEADEGVVGQEPGDAGEPAE